MITIKKESRSKHKRHSKSYHPLYVTYKHIIQRCLNPNNKYYNYYGGRGITVCDEWKNDFMTFYQWAIKNGFKKELTIDRIDNNGHYEPLNCRFVTRKIQQNNRRNNIILTIDNISKTATEWAELLNLNPNTVLYRFKKYGWTAEKSISQISHIRISQFSISGSLIRTFNSAAEVSKLLGYDSSHLLACCKGKRKTAYGFIWKYNNDLINKKHEPELTNVTGSAL